jgi:hypothetical protein
MKRFTMALSLLALACGANHPPVTATPPIVQINGVWDYTARATRLTGGTCVAASVAGDLTATGTMQANQVGSTANATLSASPALIQGGPDMVCSYLGAADATSISLTASACPSLTRSLRCVNGVQAEIAFSTGTLRAVVNGAMANGELTETYTARTGSDNVPPGQVTVLYSFTAIRR